MPKEKILEMSADETIQRFSGSVVETIYHICRETPNENIFWDILDYEFVPEIRAVFEDRGFAKKGGFVINLNILHAGKEVGYYAIFIHHICAVGDVRSSTSYIEFDLLSRYFEYSGEIYVTYDDLLMMNAWKV